MEFSQPTELNPQSPYSEQEEEIKTKAYLIKSLREQIDLLTKVQKTPPYLLNFDLFIRKRAIEYIEEMQCVENTKDKSTLVLIQDRLLSDIDFKEVESFFGKNKILKEVVHLVDKTLLEEYIGKI